ncbi:DUF2063 domain-containing protein [Epibacterium sp. SM1969]|uniref:DUF2063 domain-containing protein n=1 Tax=Tritonibacter aquimaris TaxID=2663379 RepID=A0A844AT07_9RHOB|nr:DNA-binding domain-containing protein [Tritonibacter aquimaris]MQY42887.1 DUF2063 domain-containing protein [Tritonibacter aquimaris]
MSRDPSPAAAVSQAEFTHAMMDARRDIPFGLRDSLNRPAGRRFNVYRNNVAVSLTEAMMQAFPVITKLLGEDNMKGLSGIFLRAHPPKSPLMMHYGDEFPRFIAGLDQLSHLGYLPDVARLEQAMRESYHAADAVAMDANLLGTLQPDQLMQARLTLAPAIKLIRSPWPIYDIWRFNMVEGTPAPTASAQDVLILRPEFDPELALLPQGGAAWITAVMAGKTLGEAYEVACQDTEEFDLSSTLALLLQGGALTDLDRNN